MRKTRQVPLGGGVGKTLAVQALRQREYLRSSPSRGGRRSGDVVGVSARQDRKAARVPALESEWSLPRGEGDPDSFYLGRGLCGLGVRSQPSHPYSFRLESSA